MKHATYRRKVASTLRIEITQITLLTLFVPVLLALGAFNASPAETLKLNATIALPGVVGRFDHFAIDLQGHKLFAAALGNNSLEILDLSSGKRLNGISGLKKPQGVAFFSDKNTIGVANGGDGTFKLFSGDNLRLLTTIDSLDDADNVRFDSAAQRIYVGYGDGALAIIDAKTFTKIGDIKLPAHPESFQLEHDGSRIFVNLPDAKQIAVVDREKKAVIKTWPMNQYQANFPMALDEANHRLFVGCRRPARLLVLDTTTGKSIGDLEISGDTDDLFYDGKRRLVYLSCGDGFVDVVSCPNGGKYRTVERLPTKSGARTSYFSSELDLYFLAVPNRIGSDAEIRVYQPSAEIK